MPNSYVGIARKSCRVYGEQMAALFADDSLCGNYSNSFKWSVPQRTTAARLLLLQGKERNRSTDDLTTHMLPSIYSTWKCVATLHNHFSSLCTATQQYVQSAARTRAEREETHVASSRWILSLLWAIGESTQETGCWLTTYTVTTECQTMGDWNRHVFTPGPHPSITPATSGSTSAAWSAFLLVPFQGGCRFWMKVKGHCN